MRYCKEAGEQEEEEVDEKGAAGGRPRKEAWSLMRRF